MQAVQPGSLKVRHTVRGGAAILLLLPLIAMQFTTEVRWDGADFALFAAMLAAAAGAYECLSARVENIAYRAAAGIAIVAAFLLIWANLAVGIVGSDNDPANRLFYAPPVIGIIGALVARFRAPGMAATLLAVAAAQLLCGGIALADAPQPQYVVVVAVTIAFTALWVASAALFRTAAAPR
ncbi:hypothetical protein [Sphingomonas sp.]|uniref:hypothetical protein n=1 Tax=Sphingomonas sp. TaxID=28214 RepID=UPI002ED86369